MGTVITPSVANFVTLSLMVAVILTAFMVFQNYRNSGV